MKLIISKTVKDSTIVTLRAGKYIRCGGTAKPVGVYKEIRKFKGICLDGSRYFIEVPEGIQTFGECTVRSK